MYYSVTHTGGRVALVLLPPLAFTVFLWLTRANEISFLAGLSAFFLLVFAWGSYCGWKSRQNTSLPLFSVLAFMYWIYYAMPLFWGDRKPVQIGIRIASEQSIERAMLLAVLGVGCL